MRGCLMGHLCASALVVIGDPCAVQRCALEARLVKDDQDLQNTQFLHYKRKMKVHPALARPGHSARGGVRLLCTVVAFSLSLYIALCVLGILCRHFELRNI